MAEPDLHGADNGARELFDRMPPRATDQDRDRVFAAINENIRRAVVELNDKEHAVARWARLTRYG